MLDMATAPTDEELEVARKVLAWLIDYVEENEPEAIVSFRRLRAARDEIPLSIAELESRD